MTQTLRHNTLVLFRFLLQFLPFMVGALFVFSGFVKAIDPYGFTYKIEDYLRAFGSMTALVPLAFLASVTISLLEMLIGIGLIFRIYFRWSLNLTALFMSVMTPLTLYIAIKNPVSDCGCFGDAFIISNWNTFFKNLVLLAAVVVLFLNKKSIPLFFSCWKQTALAIVFTLLGILLSVFCYRHLPLIDFLPYKIGVNIAQAMEVPQNSFSDTYSTTFIYEKNGIQKEFTLENYPENDSTWHFIDQKSVLISKGFTPPIHDFAIMNSYYDDVTDSVLYHEGSVYLLIMYDLTKTNKVGVEAAERMYRLAKSRGIAFYALTGSTDADVAVFKKENSISFPFYKTDPTTLKTVIRANPGLVLLRKGTIFGKWNWRDFE